MSTPDRFGVKGTIDYVRYEAGTALIQTRWDPGQHVPFLSTTLLRVTEGSDGFRLETVRTESEDRPGWTHPKTPEQLVSEAILAWIYAPSLAARYFANPGAAATLLKQEAPALPDYHKGIDVLLATEPREGWVRLCRQFSPQPAGDLSSSAFFRRLDMGDESCTGVSGRVTFAADPDGRRLIQSLEIRQIWGSK